VSGEHIHDRDDSVAAASDRDAQSSGGAVHEPDEHGHHHAMGEDRAAATAGGNDHLHETDHDRDGDHGDGDHDHGGHDHGDHGHGHGAGGGLSAVWHRLGHLITPHSHDAADKIDSAMEASRDGIRALWISLAVLGGTAVLQAVVTVLSGSVALLGDTLHNVADALTAVPLGIAFVLGRRAATRRYTYG
jgi:hypothetical protein